MYRRRILQGLAFGVAVGALLGIAHLGSALTTFKALSQAAQKDDVATVARLSDLPKLRASFTHSMAERLTITTDASPGFMRPMVQSMNTFVLPTLITHVVTPEGLSRVLRDGDLPSAPQHAQAPTVSADGTWEFNGNKGGPISDAIPAEGAGTSETQATTTSTSAHRTTRMAWKNWRTVSFTFNGDPAQGALEVDVQAVAPFTWRWTGLQVPIAPALREQAAVNLATATSSQADVKSAAPMAASSFSAASASTSRATSTTAPISSTSTSSVTTLGIVPNGRPIEVKESNTP